MTLLAMRFLFHESYVSNLLNLIALLVLRIQSRQVMPKVESKFYTEVADKFTAALP